MDRLAKTVSRTKTVDASKYADRRGHHWGSKKKPSEPMAESDPAGTTMKAINAMHAGIDAYLATEIGSDEAVAALSDLLKEQPPTPASGD